MPSVESRLSELEESRRLQRESTRMLTDRVAVLEQRVAELREVAYVVGVPESLPERSCRDCLNAACARLDDTCAPHCTMYKAPRSETRRSDPDAVDASDDAQGTIDGMSEENHRLRIEVQKLGALAGSNMDKADALFQKGQAQADQIRQLEQSLYDSNSANKKLHEDNAAVTRAHAETRERCAELSSSLRNVSAECAAVRDLVDNARGILGAADTETLVEAAKRVAGQRDSAMRVLNGMGIGLASSNPVAPERTR